MAQSTLTRTKSSSTVSPKRPTSKRHDIQGLRAIAVLFVVADHLAHWPSGGFVGVDVFFVISGFLITGLILREYERTGTISFVGFYKRRLRRIMPAALTVLAVTSAVAYWVFSEARAKETLLDALWSLLFAANWHFSAVGTDYFQAGGPTSPLQHFWSLAVEEQFYFVWPWLMALIFWAGSKSAGWNKAKARKAVGSAMAAIVILSFAWALFQSATNPTPAYFSTFTRAWELGVGALVAVIAPAFRRIKNGLRPVIAWIGVGGIVWSVLGVSAESSFPAPWAAVPVLATALVIIAGTGGEQRFLAPLTNRVTGYVGDVSYSLYLWHFPVIIVAGAFLPEATPEFYVAALVAMFTLSMASFHLIEEPIRKFEWPIRGREKGRNQRPPKHYAEAQTAGLAVLAVVTAGVVTAAIMGFSPYSTAPTGAAVVASASVAPTPGATAGPVDTSHEGLHSAQITAALAASSFPEFVPSIDSLGTDAWSKKAEIACMNVSAGNIDRCLTGPADATKTVAVLGDSFAVAWLPGIRAGLEPLGYKVQALTMGQCPAARVSVTLEGGAAFPACEAHQQWAVDRVRAMQPDMTILASAQDSTMRRLASGKIGQDAVTEIVAGMEKTVADLTGSTGKIAVLGSPPAGKNMQACVTKLANPRSCTSELSDDWRALTADETKAAAALGISYVNTGSWFCNADGYCPGFVGNTPVRVDTGHMTVEYAKSLAPLLARSLTA